MSRSVKCLPGSESFAPPLPSDFAQSTMYKGSAGHSTIKECNIASHSCQLQPARIWTYRSGMARRYYNLDSPCRYLLCDIYFAEIANRDCTLPIQCKILEVILGLLLPLGGSLLPIRLLPSISLVNYARYATIKNITIKLRRLSPSRNISIESFLFIRSSSFAELIVQLLCFTYI